MPKGKVLTWCYKVLHQVLHQISYYPFWIGRTSYKLNFVLKWLFFNESYLWLMVISILKFVFRISRLPRNNPSVLWFMSMTHDLNLSQCYLEFKLCTLPPPSGIFKLLTFIGQWRGSILGNEFDSQISSFLFMSCYLTKYYTSSTTPSTTLVLLR